MKSNHKPRSSSYKFICVVMLIAACIKSEAQQRPHFTQYMFNGLIINPAYAGTDGALNLTAINRSQWINVEGAPTTQTFSAHTLFKNEHLGLGLSVTNDKIGIHKNLNVLSSFAYHLQVSKNHYLSMGLQAGIDNKKSDYSSLATSTPNDPRKFQDISNTFLSLGAGVYFRSPKLQVGFSVPEIIPARASILDTVQVNFSQVNYFLFTKYRHILNGYLALEPSVLVKYLHGLPLSLELNINLIINQVISMGVSYRNKESLDFLFKAQITTQLMIGYAYDFPIGKNSLNNGSHELMVNYIFKYAGKAVSPR